jgi:acyl-homoserine lactone acylase PvdQ
MTDLTIQQVNSAIMFGNFTNEQLNSIAQAIKYRRAQMTKEKVRSFWNGDNVKFVHPKTGRVHIGVVTKVKIKNVSVRENNTTWNVPANMLEAA